MRFLRAQQFLTLFFSAFFIFISYYNSLSWSDFSDDDSHVAQLSLTYSWLEPYYKPSVYQQLSIVHFTPIVLSIYRAILLVFGVENTAFIALQIVMISLVASLAAYFCQRFTQKLTAGFVCLLLIFSNTSLLPMLSRFYTAHYILGAILTLTVTILVYQAWQQKKLSHFYFLSLLFFLLSCALLAKEIYILCVPLFGLLFFRLRAWKALGIVTTVFILYFILRFYILGTSTQGRDGQSFTDALIALDLTVWLNFFAWYMKTKWLILIATIAAFALSPTKMLGYLFIASIFAVPSLAAPHAFQNPELHGDRLFFMFDVSLSIACVLAIYSRTIRPSFVISAVLLGFLVLIPVQRVNLELFSKTQEQTVAHKINKQIVNSEQLNTIIFTPLSFQQGEFMNIYRLLGSPWLEIVQNCQQALQQSNTLLNRNAPLLIAFDDSGEKMSRASLQAYCQPSNSKVTIGTAPNFDNGLLSWSFSIPDEHTGGVLFIDRGISVNTGEFRQRIVRPKPRERYQIYTKKGNQWWFSNVELIKVHN